MPSGPRRVDVGGGGPGPGLGAAPFPVRPRRAVPAPTARAGTERTDVDRRTAPGPAVPGPGAPEDASRRPWRRRLRQRPRLHRLYRVGVAVVGGLLLVAWVLLSWLPGPGGIPLLLAALAVLATEFLWADRLLVRARAAAHRLVGRVTLLPLWSRVLGSAALGALVLGAAALGLAAALGVPGWVPEPAALQLVRLPGVELGR